MSLYEFEGKRPKIGATSYVHPTAVLIGDVTIGEKCFIGASAVLRGDYGSIVFEDGSNIQENSVVHAEPQSTALIKENVNIGHGAIIHGPCTLGPNATIGMGSIVSTGCEIQSGSFLGAGSLLTPNKKIPPNKLAMGNPARIVKDVTEQQELYRKMGMQLYQELPERYKNGLKLIEE